MARKSRRQKELEVFKEWLRKAVTRRIDEGVLKTQADIASYTKGAHKVFRKQSI